HTGTLGFDILSQFSSVTIDYPSRVFILRHQDLEYDPKVGAIELPLRIFKFRPLVDAYLNGKGPFPFLFDTGPSTKNLLVAPQIAVELGFVGRVSKLRLEKVKIGELLLESHEAEVILLPAEQEFLGIIPRGLFSSYRVTIDFKKQLIFFER
ncbi:MAG: retropepsin-like domain-containing protein, partial [Candidatus Korarchaeum sp.]|nr:retropepsin-like domain-containing protein [Candidatus Korarchaeum sp.]